VPVTAKMGVGTCPLCRFRRPDLEKPVDLKDKPVDLTVSALILERQQAGEAPSQNFCGDGGQPARMCRPVRVCNSSREYTS